MDSQEFLDWWRGQPRAPCEVALSVQLEDCDRNERSVRLSFEVGPEFTNARGSIQGGFVAAMLDTCLGIPVLLASDLRFGPVTLNLSVNYLGPVLPGRVWGEGRVAKLGRSVAFVTAAILGDNGQLLATATQSCQLFERKPMA